MANPNNLSQIMEFYSTIAPKVYHHKELALCKQNLPRA